MKPVAQFNSCAKPEYPRESLARRAQGTTTLRFLIDVDGSVAEAAVAKSSGDALLDEAARVAIAKCRFTPAMAGSTPAQGLGAGPVRLVAGLKSNRAARGPALNSVSDRRAR